MKLSQSYTQQPLRQSTNYQSKLKIFDKTYGNRRVTTEVQTYIQNYDSAPKLDNKSKLKVKTSKIVEVKYSTNTSVLKSAGKRIKTSVEQGRKCPTPSQKPVQLNRSMKTASIKNNSISKKSQLHNHSINLNYTSKFNRSRKEKNKKKPRIVKTGNTLHQNVLLAHHQSLNLNIAKPKSEKVIKKYKQWQKSSGNEELKPATSLDKNGIKNVILNTDEQWQWQLKRKLPKAGWMKHPRVSSRCLAQTTKCSLNIEGMEVINKIGEGAFGKVYKVEVDGQTKALKKVLQDPQYKNRQKDIIKELNNSFVVKIHQTFIECENDGTYLNIVMDFYEQNLVETIKRRNFAYSVSRSLQHTDAHKHQKIKGIQLKVILYQLFRGLHYLHSAGICHRDIKPHNIMHCARTWKTVICDFGSAKKLHPGQNNVSYICSRCYRAPELILGSTKYTYAVDIWSAGCVMLELIQGRPMFMAQSNIGQLIEIVKVKGTPTQSQIYDMNPDFNLNQIEFPEKVDAKSWIAILPLEEEPSSLLLEDLIKKVMAYSPNSRPTAIEVLAHSYFDEVRDEDTYSKLKAQEKISPEFFVFSPQQFVDNTFKDKLIPIWFKK